MTSRIVLLAAAVLLLPVLEAGEAQLTPREMYYHRDNAPPPPAVTSTPTTSTTATHATTARRNRTAKVSDTAKAKPTAETAVQTTEKPTATTEAVSTPQPPAQPHIGIRYTLVKVTDSGTVDTSDAATFHAGDCVQLKVESNTSGYLYVLHHGPDGNWQPLMPSPKMPDESNHIDAFRVVQIPTKYCFRFDNQPGIETLFLAIAQNEQAIPQLHRAILARNKASKPDSDPAGPTMMALNLNQQVDALRGRGLEIAEVERVVEKPKDAAETHAVYVVNKTETGNDRVVAEIRLRHE
ncbi:MAG TPA: DUF4384 domain-containing protein [Bryobacteraceae bacterium]|nr:DUF4384 domain-containing protein [Bryobacteraceae bacterium]